MNLSTSGVPKIPRKAPAPKLSYAELQAENQKLKRELREARENPGGIHLDPSEQRLDVRNITTPDFTVESLSVESPSVEKVADILSSGALAGSRGKPDLGGLKNLSNQPLRVEEMKLRIPDDTLNDIADSQAPKDKLKGVEVEFGEGGQFQVKGTAHKLVDIPFELAGFVDSTPEGEVRIKLGKSKLFGFVPIPKLISDMAGSMAGKKLEKLGVRQTDDGFVVDSHKLLPKNIDLKIASVTTQNGELVVEGGPANPKVLTMGPWGPRPPN